MDSEVWSRKILGELFEFYRENLKKKVSTEKSLENKRNCDSLGGTMCHNAKSKNYLKSIFQLLKLFYKSYHSINNKVSYHNNMIYVNDTISRDIKEYKSHDSDHSNNFEEEIRTISSEPNSEDDYLEITKSKNLKKGGSFNKGKKERD